MTDMDVIILVAGGTGGHLFPAEALAVELQQRGFDVHLITDARAKRFVSVFKDGHIHIVPSATIKGRNPIALMRTFWKLWQGNRASRKIFAQLKPKLVAGFGGYPTLAPLYAATSMRIPSFIHEQNAVMGRANRALAPRVSAIAGGFLSKEGRYADKIIRTGNPLRKDILVQADTPYKAAVENDDFHLLVFGGSQGAHFFSQILPQAVKLMGNTYRKRLKLTQQARPADCDMIKSAYKDLGIQAEIAPFFDTMGQLMAESQLIIARSGASTVAEIAALGRPSILVPYPFALDHDQAMNARQLMEKGGCDVLKQHDLTPERLSAILTDYMDAPHELVAMAQAAKAAGEPLATQKLADLAQQLIARAS